MANYAQQPTSIVNPVKMENPLSASQRYWARYALVHLCSLFMMRDAAALQKSDISFAIIASFSTSVSWIYEFFEPSTPVIIVTQPNQSGQPTIRNIFPNWVMTVPFLRNGRGCQHMKVGFIGTADSRMPR